MQGVLYKNNVKEKFTSLVERNPLYNNLRLHIKIITNDQTFYNAQLAKTITGVSPVTDKVDTIQEINSLILLNDSPGQIDFVNDNSMSLNAVLSSN